jgi:CDP-diglyceride synthetase
MVIIFDNNVSNALLYSYLSGGVIGTILILLIYILISKEIYKIVFIKKIFYSSEVINVFSTVVLIYLSLRTFYENGFAVFGLDFILAVIAYNIIFIRNNSIKSY